MMSPLVLRGRCACGRAEYAAHGAADLEAAVCYCAICRRSSGGAGMSWLGADRVTLRVNGELHAWLDADGATRQFCPACATQLFRFVGEDANVVEIAAGTLEDQKLIKHTVSVSVEERPAWDARHTLGQPADVVPAAPPVTALTKAAADAAFRSALASSPDAFLSIDPEGLITEWNRQAERTLGWTYAEAIRRPLHELIIPPEMRSAHLRGMSRLQITGEGPVLGRRFEVDAIHKLGHRLPVELFVAPLRMSGGTGATAFLRDASARRGAETAIEQALAGEAVDLELDLRLAGIPRRKRLRLRAREEAAEGGEFILKIEDAPGGPS